MSDLRDKIAQEIYESTTADEHGESQAIADTILAAVHAALTSEAAVDAAQHASASAWGPHHSDPDTETARRMVAAALRAAGITKGDE